MPFSNALFSLEGKVALVTGATRGIGQHLAQGLAGAGARLVVSGRDSLALEHTAREIHEAHGDVHCVEMDVSRVDSISAAFAQITETVGPIDILINNAGVEEVRASLDVDEATWDRIQSTNLRGAFFCSQAAARTRCSTQTRPLSIVNICSLTSEVGVPESVAYGSSKSGLVGMTRALSAEWASLNVRVNGIGPGYFRTSMTESFYQNADWCKRMLDKIPMARFGEYDDLIGAAVFLASDASAYMTGQVLYVDGGYLSSI
jgi:NAD(P)-dependent dehydrogenase (short-subunit alcohol dehydrogenase family)